MHLVQPHVLEHAERRVAPDTAKCAVQGTCAGARCIDKLLQGQLLVEIVEHEFFSTLDIARNRTRQRPCARLRVERRCKRCHQAVFETLRQTAMEECFLILLDLVYDEMRQLIEGMTHQSIEGYDALVMGKLLDEFLAPRISIWVSFRLKISMRVEG